MEFLVVILRWFTNVNVGRLKVNVCSKKWVTVETYGA